VTNKKLDPPRSSLLVVGCGPHATAVLLPAIVSLGRARILGLCDTRVELAESAADRFNVPVVGTSASSMLNQLRPDAVILAGPPSMHVKVALLALECGVHVLVEKPPARSTDELLKLAMAAENNARVGMVAHNLRYTAAWQRAVERLTFSAIESLTIEYHASGPTGERWGLPPHEAFLLSHAVHAFDLLNAALGPATETLHHLRRVRGGRFVLTTQWRSHSNVVGTAVVSTCAPRFDWNVQLVTRDGTLARIVSASEIILQSNQTDVVWPSGQRDVWRARSLDVGFDSAGYGAELVHFLDSIAGVSAASPTFLNELPVYEAIDDLYTQTGLARSASSD
jgi:predicted dehydrogenase